MREGQSRRTFLVGLGCAAPGLLGTPVAAAATRVFAARAVPPPPDPILEYLHREAVQTYRQTRAAMEDTGRIPGEHVRALAREVGLLDAYLVGKGGDVRFDDDLGLRLGREGLDATVVAITDGYRSLRETLGAHEGIVLPAEPEFAGASAAVTIMRRKGIRRTLRLVRKWAEWEAAQADRAGGRTTRVRVLAQKPGDDFLGYSEGEIEGLSCSEMGLMLDAMGVMVAILACMGDPAAAPLGAIYAAASMVKNMACR